MEAAPGVAAVHGVSLPMPSSRREWRVVPAHQAVQNAGDEDLERSKLGHPDERTLYEGRETANLDFHSITVDESLDNNDILQQRLHNIARQREGLQQIETELRAQIVARSEIMGMQNSFDAQIKEHASAAAKLQEELRKQEQTINGLERKMEEKERELHDIKLANEAAWAKEDLLREQNKELATFRRERDNSEAERAQHLNQIHDLQDHIQEKERQFLELQEQNRVAQEAIIFKDEQLREAQAFISRVQEMDALQSTTNHTLQAELRERTDQYNQLWLGCQRQFAEMERLHMHTVQQLQLELADAREKSGTYTDESRVAQTNPDVPQFGQNSGHQLDADAGGSSSETSGVMPNGTAENNPSFSVGNPSAQVNHVPGVPIAPSILGLPTYLPPGQVTALHPFVLHQQGVPHSVSSHMSQSDAAHAGQFHSMPALTSLQHWQNQQGVSEGSQVSAHNQYPPSQTEQNIMKSDGNYDYEMSVNGQALHPEYLNIHISQVVEPDNVMPSSAEVVQASESIDKSYMSSTQPQESSQQISSQFHESLRLDSLEQNSERKEKSITNHELEPIEQPISDVCVSQPEPDSLNHPVNCVETTINSASGPVLAEPHVSTSQSNTVTVGKALEVALLDERSLLACIVRTIPPGSGGRIRISSTLPNRLSKMLAPLHWHDYKKKYGKLDEFVASHPELFVIDGDYIQLREGAQEIIAATAAVAKVAAAASASPPHSAFLPSVAVTPMAQSHQLKKVPSVDSRTVKTDKSNVTATDNGFRVLGKHNQHSNGVYANVSGSFSNVKILSKPKDALASNGSETGAGRSSVPMTVGNGADPERLVSSNSQNKGSTNGRPANFSIKQQSRGTGLAGASRR